MLDFVNALELFEIGYSWGGVASLAVAYDFTGFKGRPDYGHRIVRLHIGLEKRRRPHCRPGAGAGETALVTLPSAVEFGVSFPAQGREVCDESDGILRGLKVGMGQ